MTTMNDNLAKVKEITGIQDLEHASSEDVARIDKMAAQGQLNIEQMKLLVEAIPHFVELQKATVQALQDTVAAVRDVQKEAIQSVSSSLDSTCRILEQLASDLQTDEARLRIAEHAIEIGRLGLEVAKLIESMNKDNNNLWKYIIGTIGVITFGIVTVFLIFGSGGEDSDTA